MSGTRKTGDVMGHACALPLLLAVMVTALVAEPCARSGRVGQGVGRAGARRETAEPAPRRRLTLSSAAKTCSAAIACNVTEWPAMATARRQPRCSRIPPTSR